MIVPALLTNSRKELIDMVSLCSEFCNYVQIDIMDGNFVSSESINLSELKDISLATQCEVHLMVSKPAEWILPFKSIGAKRFIYHSEISADHSSVISEIKNNGMEAGIALNPSTSVDSIDHLIPELDVILVMTVVPGFYGADFVPEALEKIRIMKKKYPNKCIGVDGGVKLSNLVSIKDTGVDYICVGSGILKADDPKQAYEEFMRLIHG